MPAGFIYEWTNKITQMKYIGAHTGTEDDGYTGGGKKFQIDLRRYGTNNFERKILEYVENHNDLKSRENYWLDLVDAAENPSYYNTNYKSSGLRYVPVKQKERGFCIICHQRRQAVNYTDAKGITHYRSKCDFCIKKKKGYTIKPAWGKSGYKKKSHCDCCGFKARFSAQLMVFHVDGNLHNISAKNLKTVCRNCEVVVLKGDLPWRPGDLEPDH
jgi:hypothetical protein